MKKFIAGLTLAVVLFPAVSFAAGTTTATSTMQSGGRKHICAEMNTCPNDIFDFKFYTDNKPMILHIISLLRKAGIELVSPNGR